MRLRPLPEDQWDQRVREVLASRFCTIRGQVRAFHNIYRRGNKLVWKPSRSSGGWDLDCSLVLAHSR